MSSSTTLHGVVPLAFSLKEVIGESKEWVAKMKRVIKKEDIFIQ